MNEQNEVKVWESDVIKHALLTAPWKRMGEFEVESAEGPILLTIRRPPPKFLTRVMEEARKTGLVDEKGEPVSPEAGLDLGARMFAPMLFLPEAKAPLFTPEELAEAPWFTEASEACAKALGVRSAVEAAKGN